MAQGDPFENALLPFTALPSAREAWVWEAVPAKRGLQEEGAWGAAPPPQPLQPPARLLVWASSIRRIWAGTSRPGQAARQRV